MKTFDVRQADWFRDIMMTLPTTTEDELIEQYSYMTQRQVRRDDPNIIRQKHTEERC